ncbi:MAG: hypothetical protein E7554_04085 [Ruminococcaceae bacterium]|nr:hypothetical protein [Oscillospiraceae bacterium]
MKKKSTHSFLCRAAAVLLAVCCIGTSLVGCGEDATVDEPVVSITDTEPSASDVVASGVQFDENNVPFVSEDFEGAAHCGQARGEGLILEVIDDNGSKALSVKGRNQNWNGVNFAAEEFRGNTISVSASVKATSPTVNLSLQYDLAGTTSYQWITTGVGAGSSYTSLNGQMAIPAEALNVFVYVESNDVADLVIDNVKINVVGDYVVPTGDGSIDYADFADYESLHKLYSDYFTIGCAIPATFVTNENQDYIKLVTQQFNSITFENECKPEGLLNQYDSQKALKAGEANPVINTSVIKGTLDYCKEHNIKVRGHVLLWHQQTPEWLFHEDYNNAKPLASREVMLERMENYIKAVMTWCNENYPDQFYAWDIVNEAIADANNCLRGDAMWTRTVGNDWIQYAFEYARKYAGEGVKLYYNDYNASVATKCNGIIKELRPVAEAGNIDGVGMQGHISTSTNIEQFVKAAWKYHEELGVEISITELDIEMPGSPNALYDQGVYFQKFFTALMQAKKDGLPLDNVTIWGLCDNISWKSEKKPLVFNGDLSRKPAFDGMVCAAKGTELAPPEDYVVPGSNTEPIYEDYEGTTFVGRPRFGSTQDLVTDNPYEGNQCLRSIGSEAYDGYSIDVTNFIGHTIKYSFAVRSDCAEMRLSGEIDGVWPNIETIDTSSGEWVFVEGTYEVPADQTAYSIYFEASEVGYIYVDNLSIELAE